MDMPDNQKPPDATSFSQYSAMDCTPTMLSKKFLDDSSISVLVQNKNNNAQMKGKHGFQITPAEVSCLSQCTFHQWKVAQLPHRQTVLRHRRRGG